MQSRFRDRVPRLIAELDHLEPDDMPSARKVAMLYGTMIDDLIWSSQNGIEFTAQNADDYIETYLVLVAQSRDGGVGE